MIMTCRKQISHISYYFIFIFYFNRSLFKTSTLKGKINYIEIVLYFNFFSDPLFQILQNFVDTIMNKLNFLSYYNYRLYINIL